MITQERLKELLDYHPETGKFYWIKSGKEAGTVLKDGRIQIQIDGKLYKAHRLAWLYEYGKFPTNQIDHKNRDFTDNRLSNLRDVDQSTNLQNNIKPSKRNKTGFYGVSYEKSRGKFIARINVEGVYKFLGRFDTAEEAYKKYLEVKIEKHKGFISDNCTCSA